MSIIRSISLTSPDMRNGSSAASHQPEASSTKGRSDKKLPSALTLNKWKRGPGWLRSQFDNRKDALTHLPKTADTADDSRSDTSSSMSSLSTASEVQTSTPHHRYSLGHVLKEQKELKEARKALKNLHSQFFKLQKESLADARPDTASMIEKGYVRYLEAEGDSEIETLRLKARVLSEMNSALEHQQATSRYGSPIDTPGTPDRLKAPGDAQGGFDVDKLIVELKELQARMFVPAVDPELAGEVAAAERDDQQTTSRYGSPIDTPGTPDRLKLPGDEPDGLDADKLIAELKELQARMFMPAVDSESAVETPATPVATRNGETSGNVKGGVDAGKLALALEKIKAVQEFKELEDAALQELRDRIKRIN